MINLKVHYVTTDDYTSRCGVIMPENSTIYPDKVTCGNCNRLLRKEVK